MKMTIYSIYDKATEAYMRPFFAQSDGQAVRMFTDEARKPETEINKHAEDYALFRIGTFSDGNAEIQPEEPKCLCRAHEIVRNSDDG